MANLMKPQEIKSVSIVFDNIFNKKTNVELSYKYTEHRE